VSVYLKLEDAQSLVFPDGSMHVETATEYLGWHAAHIQSRRIARVWNSDKTIPAYVNHGRWLADCQTCGKGMFTHPVWRMACCAECGAVYRAVDFPEQLDTITRLLLERPCRENQNWRTGETLFELKLENFFHRLAAL
jgi:hypothetical protein